MLTVVHALRYVFGGWLGGVSCTLLAVSVVLAVLLGPQWAAAIVAAAAATLVLAVIVFGGLYRIHREHRP